MMDLSNPTPVVFDVVRRTPPPSSSSSLLDAFDVYDIIADPEHPYTLEQLKVVHEDKVTVREEGEVILSLTDFQGFSIRIEFAPTVPHCSLSTTIGLCIREKLKRDLPPNCKIDIFLSPGSHNTEEEVNKQINDKERVAAAMENPHLKALVEQCIAPFEF